MKTFWKWIMIAAGVLVPQLSIALASDQKFPPHKDIVEWGRVCGSKIKTIRGRKTPYPVDLRGISPSEKAMIEDAFIYCLQHYIRIPTVNPPGHENEGAFFLQEISKVLGWKSSLQKVDEGRSNWVTRVGESSGIPESVLLLHHIDVVDAQPDQWNEPDLPFSGRLVSRAFVAALKPGELMPQSEVRREIWGRGAVDMKGLAILQILSTALIENSEFKIRRRAILIGVADEESGGAGARAIVSQIKAKGLNEDLMNARVLLNEGGFGIQDAVKKNENLFVVGAEEKGGAWLKLRTPKSTSLVRALGAMGLISAPNNDGVRRNLYLFKNSIQKAECSFLSLRAPTSAINVVSSSLKLVLNCKKPLELPESNENFKVKLEKGDQAQTHLSFESATTSHGAIQSRFQLLSFIMSSLLESKTLQKPNEGITVVKSPYVRTNATRALLKTSGSSWFQSFDMNRVLDISTWIEQFAMKRIGEKLFSESLFRNSCQWTSWTQDQAEAEAWVDCRLIKNGGNSRQNSDGDKFAQELISMPEFTNVRVEIAKTWNFTQSPINNKILKIFEDEISWVYARSRVTAYMFPAGSDSRFFREASLYGAEIESIPSYGYSSFLMPKEIIRTPHASDERLPIDFLQEAVHSYYRTLGRLLSEPSLD